MFTQTTLTLAALALFSVLVQDIGELPGEEPAPPLVIIESKGGEIERLLLEDYELRTLEESGVALIRFEGLEALNDSGEEPDSARVDLVGGGRVIARIQGGDGEFLDLGLIGNKRLRLSIEELEAFRIPERFPSSWTEPVVPAVEGDRLYRVRGGGVDRIDGAVEEFSPLGVSMDTALGSKEFPWSEVGALFIETFEDEAREEGQGLVVVDLMDGSRLPLGFKALGPEGLDLVTRMGKGLRLPLDVVAEVLVADSGIQFLSELEAAEAEVTSPFGDDLGMVWPLRRDRSTSGAPLRAGGRTWTRGIGVHAPSRVLYELDGSWQGLRGFVAIDEEVIPLPARGSVIFRVRADEELLWESPVLRGGDWPIELPKLPMAGVRRLVLEVDMADEMHVGDRADWLRLILSR